VRSQRTQDAASPPPGASAERWALWAAEVPATPAGLRRARAELAEALVRAGWGADAGRVLVVAGDAMSRALAGCGAAERIDVAFLVGRRRAGVRIAGRGRATAYPWLIDRIEHRPAREGARVLMSFRRELMRRGSPRPR
jgi:hypothetical protein